MLSQRFTYLFCTLLAFSVNRVWARVEITLDGDLQDFSIFNVSFDNINAIIEGQVDNIAFLGTDLTLLPEARADTLLGEATALIALNGLQASDYQVVLHGIMTSNYTVDNIADFVVNVTAPVSPDLEKRAKIFSFIRQTFQGSSGHATTVMAGSALLGGLSKVAAAYLDYGVRSVCASYAGDTACASWSGISTTIARTALMNMISDEMSYFHEMAISGEERSALFGYRKRDYADACLSNRATGCT